MPPGTVPACAYRREVTTALAHDPRGRFRSAWRDDALLDILIPVARTVNGHHPTRVTMQAWDAQRGPALDIAEPERWPPTARAIVMRLNSRGPRHLTWRHWLEIARGDAAQRRAALTAQQRSEATCPLSDARVRYALQRVARHLAVETLTPDEYDQGCNELAGRDRRRRRGEPGKLVELLPTSGQLQQGRAWRSALRVGGLQLPAPRERRYHSGAIHAGGMPQVDAQLAFFSVNGRLASLKTLQRFMSDCGAALADWLDDRPYSDCYDEAERRLRQDGHQDPVERPRRGYHSGPGRPVTYELPPGRVIPGAPPSAAAPGVKLTADERREHLRGRCLDGLRAFLDWLAVERPGVRPTQKRYLIWRRGTRWPAPSAFQQFGGFAAMLDDARQMP